MPSRLTELAIDEVSFVDRPADPNARIELFKRDSSDDKNTTQIVIKSQPSSHDVMEEEVLGGSTPSKKRKRKKKMKEDSMEMEKSESDDSEEPDTEERHMPETDLEFTPEQEEYVRKAEDDLMDAQETIESLTAELEVAKAASTDDPPAEDEILKSASPEVVELLKAAEARAAEAEEIAKAERTARLKREALAKAADYEVIGVEKDELGSFLYDAGEKLDTETMDTLHGILKTAAEAAEVADIYKELGGSGPSLTDGEARLDSLAKSVQESDGISYEAAYDRVLQENPDLYETGGN